MPKIEYKDRYIGVDHYEAMVIKEALERWEKAQNSEPRPLHTLQDLIKRLEK